MFINVRQRPNTVGLLVGADARTSVPTVRGLIIACVTYYSLVLACWPAQGAATTMDAWCGAAG